MPKPFTSSAPRGVHASAFSMLGADTTLVGNIQAQTDLHIEGKVEGDIACQSLVQGEGSEISGAVQAQSVRLAGLVRGSVVAREVVILRTARIEGDLTYDALTIEQGARLDGRLSPNGGQMPPALVQLTNRTPRPQEAKPQDPELIAALAE
ncbi:hypothetical protein WSK_3648 [Novosphingobium sp. Rr 2-17]|uniref:bactofilin family protein n=1 Tax=Novosphingobium sp. Rr 2-17 TaxID=555793 RepID=UPI0002697BB6|nr:polymer-forming cytoskeletal protein [Novosphingobium sp. Rr 2-17]EIZ77639.1 hypothetical protein WSK_3648 [Novosphingobium sp. Rr 2-17]